MKPTRGPSAVTAYAIENEIANLRREAGGLDPPDSITHAVRLLSHPAIRCVLSRRR